MMMISCIHDRRVLFFSRLWHDAPAVNFSFATRQRVLDYCTPAVSSVVYVPSFQAIQATALQFLTIGVLCCVGCWLLVIGTTAS